MAQPNGLNPKFAGSVTGAGYEALHGHGISTTARSTSGTTAQDLLGTINNTSGTVTGWFIVAEGGISATISLSVGGVVISTISQGATTGAILASTTPFTETTFALGGTAGIYSSSALSQGKARCFVTYAVLNP